jgi:hypothetical protein
MSEADLRAIAEISGGVHLETVLGRKQGVAPV